MSTLIISGADVVSRFTNSMDIVVYVDEQRMSRSFCMDGQALQGPVVQSVVSLTSLLRVILLTVLVDSIYNILIFFAEKM